jgi:hypothetical protein
MPQRIWPVSLLWALQQGSRWPLRLQERLHRKQPSLNQLNDNTAVRRHLYCYCLAYWATCNLCRATVLPSSLGNCTPGTLPGSYCVALQAQMMHQTETPLHPRLCNGKWLSA